ncbi:MAG: DUF4446 family protein [Lachnospiraceae bacterium]|nr:DUF4446 family protein [Lachnospiraceae bacterium]
MAVFEKIGIDPGYIIIGMLVLLLVLLILYIVLINKLNKYRKTYDTFMEGSDGKNLEASMLSRFEALDKLKENTAKNNEQIEAILENLKFTYQKFGIVKYDAFKEMGGKLSFSVCMLTDNNDGFVLTSMHSTNEGCYTYIKEIIKGESYILLGEEEKKVLDMAKNRRSVLDDE